MEHTQIPRYPLEWPLGWRRSRTRKSGLFKTVSTEYSPNGNFRRSRQISMADAAERLETELNKLGAKESVLSTNVTLTLTGRPRGDENPSDPGAAVYFKFKGRATVLACDTYYRVADNIAALAAHLEALRAIERYGVGTIEQALAGYKALPADTAADWRSVFAIPADLRTGVAARVEEEFKRLARLRHPDITKDDGAAMAHLNRARDYAIAELEGRS